MIRILEGKDIDAAIQIWFEANKKAHDFIPESYWLGKFDEVKNILPQAEVYVYEDNNEIKGFIMLCKKEERKPVSKCIYKKHRCNKFL